MSEDTYLSSFTIHKHDSFSTLQKNHLSRSTILRSVRTNSNLCSFYFILFSKEVSWKFLLLNHSHHAPIGTIQPLHFSVFYFVCVCGFVYMEKSTACLVSVIVILCCFCCINHVTSDALDHRYKEGDFVPFYANKVGPFHNPRLDFQCFHFFMYPFKIYFDLNTPQIILLKRKKNKIGFMGCVILRLRFKNSVME